jgi:hypothetical protein
MLGPTRRTKVLPEVLCNRIFGLSCWSALPVLLPVVMNYVLGMSICTYDHIEHIIPTRIAVPGPQQEGDFGLIVAFLLLRAASSGFP